MKLKPIVIILMVLVSILALGCVGTQTSEKTSIESPTSKQTESSKNIVISYSSKKVDTFGRPGEVGKAPVGKVFLIVTMNIENHGYKEFSVNPQFFSLISNKVKYNIAFIENMFLENKLDPVVLLDGGSVKGNIVFTVPLDIENYQLQHDYYGDYNIIYKVI